MSTVKESFMRPPRSRGTRVVLTHSPLSSDPKSFPKTANGSTSFKTRFSAKFLGGDDHVNNVLRKRLRVSLKFGSKDLVDNMVKDTQLTNRAVCRLTRNCRPPNLLDDGILNFAWWQLRKLWQVKKIVRTRDGSLLTDFFYFFRKTNKTLLSANRD